MWRAYCGPPFRDVTEQVTLESAVERSLAAALSHGQEIEVCGLLLGRRRGETYVVELLWSAPNLSPTPQSAFVVDPGAVVAAHDAAAERGLEVLGAWHSHPSGDLDPSERDRAEAWPGQLMLIAARVA